MEFALTLETDLSKSQMLSIIELSTIIKTHFHNKSYGEGVKKVLIGIMALEARGLEHIFKIRKPKFIDFKIIKDGLGNPVEISKSLGWDVKPNYELLKDSDGVALQSVISQSIIDSFKELKLPKKVQNFELNAFIKDVEDFLKDKIIDLPSA